MFRMLHGQYPSVRYPLVRPTLLRLQRLIRLGYGFIRIHILHAKRPSVVPERAATDASDTV